MRLKKNRLLLAGVTLCILSSFNRAEQALTLDQCITLALNNNHLIKSVGQELRASHARVKQAWAFPQPEFSYDSDLQSRLFGFRKSAESYVGITQLLEFPGRRYLRGKIAVKESDMMGCEVELIRQEIIYSVKQHFYQLLLAMEIRTYAESNLEMARDYLNRAQEKYDSGEAAKFEVLRARVEAARADHQLKIAANHVKLAKTGLNFLLAREELHPLQITGNLKKPPLRLELQDLKTMALASRPELKKQRLAVRKETLAKSLAALSLLPDVALGISRHHIDHEPTTWDVSISFQLPLFFWQKVNGEIAEARANQQAARERLKHLELSAALEVESAYYNTTSLRDQVEFFEKEVLEEAEEVYRMTMISYQEGKSGAIEVIEARRSLLELKQAYGETLFNYQLALAELEKSLAHRLGEASSQAEEETGAEEARNREKSKETEND